MEIQTTPIRPGAVVRIRHERPYDFDEKRGIWLTRPVDEDELVHNLITDAGRVQLHTYCYGTASRSNGFNYIALSNNGTAPAAGDTALTGELSGNGLSRAQGVVTLPTGSGNQTTVAYTFTFSGASQAVQKTALFDAAAVGNMNHEILFTQRTLFTSDTLTVTFTLTLA